ncbi:hypothetical protein GCM10018790_14020 [Kitasatospora xanthocidica]|uniref:hypothetical protein n=1 Tax=Kitasatospora xanthocidica TaxID=83382 RepID=UPI0016799BEB|nr:hypothetical protein [Kitasatospora xanthocidica]GHF37557.1 hypothetical protein GCM10018790_14020 [Kitasatospora xanthocidica]
MATTRRLRHLAAAALAFTAGACGGGPAAQQQAAPPPLGRIPSVTSLDQVARPIDTYVPKLDDEKKLIQARDLVIGECMRRYGVAYSGGDLNGMDTTATGYHRATPVYGFFGTDVPASRGYDRVTRLTPPAPQSSEYVGVLTGVGRDGEQASAPTGDPVPVGGCAKAGAAAIGGDLPRPDEHSLPGGGPRVPTTDPRLVAAYAQWSRCMRDKGFAYADPMAAYLDPKWVAGSTGGRAEHGKEEKETASADVECKKATNLVGVAVAVQSAYDSEYITSNSAQLAEFSRDLGERLRIADRILSGGGVG